MGLRRRPAASNLAYTALKNKAFVGTVLLAALVASLVYCATTPPAESPESVLLASATDGLVLVLQAHKTRWELAKSTADDLEGARVPIVGAILNKGRLAIPGPLNRLL